MRDLLAQYYQGILERLRAEVDSINSLLDHAGVKGEANEAGLRDLLTRFIPKKYGVGTGLVIDRLGNTSRQCDIVIYDELSYPSLLSLTSSYLFPMDIVYVTIEVKTTLDSQKAATARDNIASVRSLTVPEQLRDPPPLGRVTRNGKHVYRNLEYSPPAGCVFAYNSSASNFETFKGWFAPDRDALIPRIRPTLVGCLDQGIIRFRDTCPGEGDQPEAHTVPVRDDKTHCNVPASKAAGQWDSHKEVRYPVKQVKSENILVDQSRVLLLFLLYLEELVRIKRMSPRTEFPIHYLDRLMEFAEKL